jgi:hypothetical protein
MVVIGRRLGGGGYRDEERKKGDYREEKAHPGICTRI